METYQIILLATAGVIAIIYIVQRYIGIDILAKIIQCRPILAAISAQVKAVSGVLPSDYLKTIMTVLEAASKGTQAAEELWKMGQLPKDERNAYAKKLASEILTEAGIEVTAQIQMIIDGAIEIVCMLMPHGVAASIA